MCTMTFPSRVHRDAASEAAPSPADLTGPIIQLLDELAQVIAALSDEQYVRNPVGVMPSHIGGHVRHSLDHVRALLTSIRSGRIDYDHRERGTPIESSRWAALRAIQDLIDELRPLRAVAMEAPLTMFMMMTANAQPIELSTTFTREAGYVLSHTIHHNAIIGAMVKTLGGWLSPRFGYAPSTIAHQRNASCAP